MKTTSLSFVVFGFCVAAALSASTSRAGTVARSTKDRITVEAQARETTRQHPNRTVYIVSNDSITGSKIPSVTRVYRGNTTTSANRAIVYNDLGITGTDNVAGALIKLDPSFTRGR